MFYEESLKFDFLLLETDGEGERQQIYIYIKREGER